MLLDIKIDTIVTAIKDSLLRMQLSLNDLGAQAYDGASNMFGNNTGVSVQIAAEQPKALSTHCQGHSLNLEIKITMTSSKQMKDIMGTVTEIISLVKYSSSRRRCSVRKGVLRNFVKLIGKHLCQSLFFNKVEMKSRGEKFSL